MNTKGLAVNRPRATPRQSGLTRIEVAAIIACVFLLGIFLLLPALAKAQQKAQRASCINNLMQIGIAFRTWGQDFSKHYPMDVPVSLGGTREWLAGSNAFRHFVVMSNLFISPRPLICPSDDRQAAVDFAHMSNQNLSYFVGLDADELRPNMWLAGDRNLVTNTVATVPGLVLITEEDNVAWSKTMHKGAGNIALSDGSVEDTTTADLREPTLEAGTNLIRLAVP